MKDSYKHDLNIFGEYHLASENYYLEYDDEEFDVNDLSLSSNS